MFQEHQKVFYQGQEAIVWLILGCIDAYDYIVKLDNGVFQPVLKADLSEIQH